MLTESEKRAAALAVSRYGADRARVKEAARAALQAQADGLTVDFLNTLVSRDLLSPSQANELRRALDVTQIDPNGPRRAPGGANGTSSASSREFGTINDGDVLQSDLDPEPDPRRVGNYQILRKLGEGGMGSVYLGYQEAENQYVAIKVLPRQLASDQAYVERFEREARSFLHLNHPNIVRGIAVDRDPQTGKQHMVLEYVEGPSAHALIDRFGKLSVGDAVHIVLDIARGLEHAHSRNIIHRDIKPDNILLTPSGIAKLADLGLAKRLDENSSLTGARQGFGTPYYMPYEQALNARQADGRSDIYALGATLYHLLTGNVPFPGNNPVEIAEKKDSGAFTPASALSPEVPKVLDDILRKMMGRLPKERFQTASELIVALERSNLSALVPSFVDQELALQDPVVRARLSSPPQPTQLDAKFARHETPRSDDEEAQLQAFEALPQVSQLPARAADRRRWLIPLGIGAVLGIVLLLYFYFNR